MFFPKSGKYRVLTGAEVTRIDKEGREIGGSIGRSAVSSAASVLQSLRPRDSSFGKFM